MEIKEKEEFKVVGLQITTTVQECISNNPHPKLWKDFLEKAEKIRNRVGNKSYGVSKEISKKECKFTSLACFEVDDLNNIPEGLTGMTVPKSKYAVFTHKGKLEDLTETYRKLYEEDMPKSGLKQKEIWMEVYDERYIHGSEDSIMEIWVAVE
jgi:AraC family transcriptional regulator